MSKIREQIIHTSTHEAEKNKFIFFNEIEEIKAYSTHSKAWVRDRYYADGTFQPILLLNCDSSSLPINAREDYGVLVITPYASRYKEAVGLLVRKTFSSNVQEDEEGFNEEKADILKTKHRIAGFKK
jgi:hypothetical protein